MIGVQVKQGDNPNEVILQGNVTCTTNAQWETIVTVPAGIRGQLRTAFISAGQPYSGVWQTNTLRLLRGAATLWSHSYYQTSGSVGGFREEHFDLGVEVEPGDLIQIYITGTPSFSIVAYCTATVMLPSSVDRFQSDKSYPICGLYFVDTGRPDICRLAALSALLGYMLHSDPHLFGGIPTRLEAL